AFVGGGLANVIAACRVAEAYPNLRIIVLERGPTLGGDHTWSFHDTDLSEADREYLEPAIARQWSQQEVRFPAFSRTLETGYNMMTSATLHSWAMSHLADRVHLNTDVSEIRANQVTTNGGDVIRAAAVIDGRGPTPSPALALGFQKFLGLELEMTRPHGIAHPVLMDATVDQLDGFRFIYLLPLSETALLVEDTRYSDTSRLDVATLNSAIQDYCASKGWTIAREIRSESAALPIVLAGSTDEYFSKFDENVALTGLRGLLFHPLTSYSVPDAARAADLIVRTANHPKQIPTALRDLSRSLWRSRAFMRLLARMMFVGADAPARRAIMQRFYKLPQDLIERFYSASLTPQDKLRILCGRPPIALHRAVASLPPRSGLRFAARGQHRVPASAN
ncbi:MAG: lycopene beta-cyclase CrtY, partial [Pseudomonadota bacterium]